MRESVVERYLHKQVKAAGGDTRKYGRRRGDPDRIVFWPDGTIHFVETKATGKKPRKSQIREHKRLLKMGHIVRVIDTLEKVDSYIVFNA